MPYAEIFLMEIKLLGSDRALAGVRGRQPRGQKNDENFTQFFKGQNLNFYENVAKLLNSFHFF